MKIVFMGTPDFAVPALQALYDGGHEIGYVITQQDKAKDRGKKVQFPPVKELAVKLGIEVLQPERLSGNLKIRTLLDEYAPDLIVVAAYGKLLPPDILNLPKLGSVNIHASLLPRHRGAAPIQRAILEGDAETGVTIMQMAEGLDTGDMIARRKTPVDGKTAGALFEELAVIGAALLAETLPSLENGAAVKEKQNDSMATYAPMIHKADGRLDFTQDPKTLERVVRGFDPWPGAFTTFQGETMKVWGAAALEERNSAPAGTITDVLPEGIQISAGGKTLLITVIQMPGNKRMPLREFLKGNKIEKNAVLG